ncbi:hypothetical protein GCM10020255_079580 [Rhodococcus baikonurensis]
MVVAVAGIFGWFARGDDALAGENLDSFPAVDHSALTAQQSALLTVLEQEWESGAPAPSTPKVSKNRGVPIS